MATISPGEALVTIEAGTVDDDDYEEIFLHIQVEGRDEDYWWYMQKHEALSIIAGLSKSLLALERPDGEIDESEQRHPS